jgi:hypothetical protein
MKSTVLGALLAGYKLWWPSVAQAGSIPPTTQRVGHEVMHRVETDPFGVSGLGEAGVRKSRLGLELCPGQNEPSRER